jgi:hypothetical protein
MKKNFTRNGIGSLLVGLFLVGLSYWPQGLFADSAQGSFGPGAEVVKFILIGGMLFIGLGLFLVLKSISNYR